jgi:hypothetical protein
MPSPTLPRKRKPWLVGLAPRAGIKRARPPALLRHGRKLKMNIDIKSDSSDSAMTTLTRATQLIESKATSLNQIAATFSKIGFKPGETNLDYGGGRFDKASELLALGGARNVVYDPFNRDESHNLRARLVVARMGGAHSATINNVLNVIAEQGAIDEVAQQAANGLRDDGRAFFLIHEGDRSGVGKATSKGWQRNQKTADYMQTIQTYFGQAKRSGNLIEAREPKKSDSSLFDMHDLSAEILALAKQRGVPMPSSKHGVGKLIGGCLYTHRSAWDALPKAELDKALSLIPASFEPTIAKWEASTGSISLIESKKFDTHEEPAIQNAIKVFADGRLSPTREKADPQIYHHKWNFVRPDYEGFDYLGSVIRSISWSQLPCDRSRIGTRSTWEAEVVWPQLLGQGAVGPKPLPAISPVKSKAKTRV